MADWHEVARREKWHAGVHTARVTLGQRKHTVRVLDRGTELEFVAEVPVGASDDDLVRLLETNRTAGLAFWYVTDGQPFAMSMCPKSANPQVMAAYMRETAALADRYELRVSEIDR